ncbi:MAG TPA: T9SS type A sorting domain-containing protein [Flavobacterium sp.]|nr:T9SS type A sorting domain-containing protein [Flavobacterium sp.]
MEPLRLTMGNPKILSFDIGTGFSSSDYANIVRAIEVQPDGKILVGGFFGCPLRNLGRFNSDGSVDETFLDDVGFDTQGIVYGAVIQPDEKIILVGEFTKYNSYFRNGILRLHGDETADVESQEKASSSIQVYPNPTKDYINITSEEIIQSIETYDITGRLVKAELINRFETQQNIDNLANGTYLLIIKTDKTEVIKKIVKE